jgi:GntR family transcriptional regulator
VILIRPNPSSGVPIYLQLIAQVKHAIESGTLRPGDQLPGIRKVSEDLVINPNTVAKAWRELEHENAIEMRKGLGVFVKDNGGAEGGVIQKARPIMRASLERMTGLGLQEEQLRRLFESELIGIVSGRRRR